MATFDSLVAAVEAVPDGGRVELSGTAPYLVAESVIIEDKHIEDSRCLVKRP